MNNSKDFDHKPVYPYVVIKVNDEEKYAVPMCSGSRQECEVKIAYLRGLLDGTNLNGEKNKERFELLHSEEYWNMEQVEARGGKTTYQQLIGE